MLPLTEMQIRYTRRDAKLIDYLVELPAGGKFAGAKVGVSVTRAMKYEPGPLQTFRGALSRIGVGLRVGGHRPAQGPSAPSDQISAPFVAGAPESSRHRVSSFPSEIPLRFSDRAGGVQRGGRVSLATGDAQGVQRAQRGRVKPQQRGVLVRGAQQRARRRPVIPHPLPLHTTQKVKCQKAAVRRG